MDLLEGASAADFGAFSAALGALSALTALHFASVRSGEDPTPAFAAAVRQLRNLQSLSADIFGRNGKNIADKLLPAARLSQQLTCLRLQLALDHRQPADAQVQAIMQALASIASLRRVELRPASERQTFLSAAPETWEACGDAGYGWCVWDVAASAVGAAAPLAGSKRARTSNSPEAGVVARTAEVTDGE
jgi:hypothetical protein